MNYAIFIFLCIFPLMAEVYETEVSCAENRGKTIVDKKIEACEFSILCNDSRVDLLLTCPGRRLFSFDPKFIGLDEDITSIYFVHPRLVLTTKSSKGMSSVYDVFSTTTKKRLMTSKEYNFKFDSEGVLQKTKCLSRKPLKCSSAKVKF